jgi:hypothetical protein
MLLEEFSRAPMQMKFKKQFSVSGRLIKNWGQKYQICLRKPRLRRPLAPGQEAVAKFIPELPDAMKQMDHRHIGKADETS